MTETKVPKRAVPAAAWITLLIVLAVAAWATVFGEYRMMGQVSALTVAPALLFTSFLVLWPFLGGLRKGATTLRHAVACHACGSLRIPMPRVPFCISCGSFPKAANPV